MLRISEVARRLRISSSALRAWEPSVSWLRSAPAAVTANTVMEPHLFRVKPGGGSGESYSHEGEEFLHILRGRFEIWLNDTEHHLLKPGDSLYFESSMPHRWKNPGKVETCLLWINTPPT